MTNRDLKVAYLKDTGRSIYNIEYKDMADVDVLLEYIDWLEKKVIDFDEYMKLVREVDKNTNEALKLLDIRTKDPNIIP